MEFNFNFGLIFHSLGKKVESRLWQQREKRERRRERRRKRSKNENRRRMKKINLRKH